jgi:hypothetical protein
MQALKRNLFSLAAGLRVLRGGVLYALLGPLIGLATFVVLAIVTSPPGPPYAGSLETEIGFFIAMIFAAYPMAIEPAFVTGAIVGLISYKGIQEKRWSLALKSFVIGAIVSFLYFGGWRWPSIWRYLSVNSIEALAPMVAAGSVAAAISSLLFYRYVNPGHRTAGVLSP